MDINTYLHKFTLPDYVPATMQDVDEEYEDLHKSFPEFKRPPKNELEKWRDNIAVNRFIDRILDKIVKYTGFNINEL